MIAEASEVAFLGRIHELAFGEGHKIEVLDALFIILDGTASERWLIDDFANILKNEIICQKIRFCSKAVPLLFGLDDRHIGKFLALEALILTC